MSKTNKILIVIIVNIVIIISQITFGYISNSFALIADALHNAGDVLSIIITYIALILATKSTTFKKTFGYLRAEMMATFVNTLFLYITMIYMIYESINRFSSNEIINPIYMIFVGLIAVIANGISAYVLKRINVDSCGHNHSQENYSNANIYSAYLHMLSDTLISVSVVIAGIFIYFFKIYLIDTILTILFSLFILFHSYKLLKKSFLSLMDINIMPINESEIQSIILENTNVISYTDLHIYSPSSKSNFISFILILDNKNISFEEIDKILEKIKLSMKKIGFNHIVIEVSTADKENKCSLISVIEKEHSHF